MSAEEARLSVQQEAREAAEREAGETIRILKASVAQWRSDAEAGRVTLATLTASLAEAEARAEAAVERLRAESWAFAFKVSDGVSAAHEKLDAMIEQGRKDKEEVLRMYEAEAASPLNSETARKMCADKAAEIRAALQETPHGR